MNIICTGETYKAVVKLTFAKGAALDDPSGLFNSSLEGNARRAIDIHEGERDRRGGAEGAHSRRRGAEHVKQPPLARPVKEVKDGPMTNTATETRSVVVEREIPYPPEKIWRALTEPHLIEEWLMKNDFEPVVGPRVQSYAATGAPSTARSSRSSRNRTLSYSWAAHGLESVVTWTLTPTSKGTTSAHGAVGLPPGSGQAYRGAKMGWGNFFAKLEQVLAREA